MPESVWLFGCRLGLAQGTCGKRKHDPKSRGASQRMGGCASCKHRTSANQRTAQAEGEYASA
jgi:hypothetical protein